jgi:hypothetical protein
VAGSSAGYKLGVPVAAATVLTTAAVVSGVLAVRLPTMLGDRDLRSPFVCLMLIMCVITDRRPEGYLPSGGCPSAGPELPGRRRPYTHSDRVPAAVQEYVSDEFVTLPVL